MPKIFDRKEIRNLALISIVNLLTGLFIGIFTAVFHSWMGLVAFIVLVNAGYSGVILSVLLAVNQNLAEKK